MNSRLAARGRKKSQWNTVNGPIVGIMSSQRHARQHSVVCMAGELASWLSDNCDTND